MTGKFRGEVRGRSFVQIHPNLATRTNFCEIRLVYSHKKRFASYRETGSRATDNRPILSGDVTKRILQSRVQFAIIPCRTKLKLGYNWNRSLEPLDAMVGRPLLRITALEGLTDLPISSSHFATPHYISRTSADPEMDAEENTALLK